MSLPGSSASLPRRQDDAGGGSSDEPPRKQQKLDLGTQQPMMEPRGICEAPVSNAKIDDLPENLILRIFSFLSFAELDAVTKNVCIKWRKVSHDPVLYRNKEYCIDDRKPDADVKRVIKEWPELRNVVMKRGVGPSVFRALTKYCSHLDTLIIDRSQLMSCHLLKKLVEKCHNIQSLTIPERLLVKKCKANILAQLHLLKSLHVTYAWSSGKEIHLRPLADRCHQLANLKISKCVSIDFDELEYFIKVRCKTLTHLDLPHTKYTKTLMQNHQFVWDHRYVIPLLKQCSSLKYLKLDNLWENKDSMLENFTVLGHLTNLRSLFLNSLGTLPAEASANIFKSCALRHLQVLQITHENLEDDVVMNICRHCPEMKELRLKYCKRLTDKALSELHHLKNLETLALIYCKELGPQTIPYVAQVPKLRMLLLEMCDLRKLEAGLQHILNISSLEILSIAFNRFACYVHFDEIPEKLTKLRVLNVLYCELYKGVLEQLKEQMPGLTILAFDFKNIQTMEEYEQIMRL